MAVATKKRPSKPSDKPRRFWPFGRRRRAGAAPLDFGGFADFEAEAAAAETGPRYETLGDELRAARQDKGLTLEELAETTRVRRAYLQALEEMRLEALPSRPFTIGYVRASAAALGLDADAAVERFKAEEPVLEEPLRAPVGVPDDRDPRIAAFIAGAIVIIAAIMTWNIAQRAMTAAAPPPPKASDDIALQVLAKAKAGPVELGKPLPAPVESTTPAPYETPGLAAAGADGKGNLAPPTNIRDMSAEPLIDVTTLPPLFVPAGTIYGAPINQSVVTIQAIKGGALIIRGGDGSVYFARQLAKGEAYRIPQVAGLTVDVSDREAFQVFAYGRSLGILPGQQTLASKLVVAPPAPVARAPAPAAAAPAAPAPKAPTAPAAPAPR